MFGGGQVDGDSGQMGFGLVDFDGTGDAQFEQHVSTLFLLTLCTFFPFFI